MQNNELKNLLFIVNLEKFDRYPVELQEKIFEKLFGVAEVANLTPEQLDEYDESLKVYRDLKGCLDTAFDDGFQEAIKKLNPQLEQERQRTEAAEQQAEEEKRRAEAAKQQAEDVARRAEEALQTMLDNGISESVARKSFRKYEV